MKKTILFYISIILFFACNKQIEKDNLVFETKQVNSKFLQVEAVVNGIKKDHSIQSSIKLSNIYDADVVINDIALSTPEGIWSSIEGGFGNFILSPNQDTIINLSISPINNSKLYQLVGQKGILKPNYTIRIDFLVGNEQFDLNIVNKLPDEQYNAYKKLFSDTITTLSYRLDSTFNSNQKEYETKLKAYKNESNFLNISRQELAISGIIMKLHGFQEKDSILSQLSIVNHSDLDVMMDTTLFGFHTLNQPILKNQVRIDKISGSQLLEERKMIRKGDRIVVNIKQPVVANDTSTFYLALKNVFILKTRESLFFGDIALDKTIVTNY